MQSLLLLPDRKQKDKYELTFTIIRNAFYVPKFVSYQGLFYFIVLFIDLLGFIYPFAAVPICTTSPQPMSSAVASCPYYEVSNTASATQNTGTCIFQSCGIYQYHLTTGCNSSYSCFGSPYLILTDQTNNEFLASGPSNIYALGDSPSCANYSIAEGCVGSGYCASIVTIAKYPLPGAAPTFYPSFRPTLAPAPIYHACPYFSTSNTNNDQTNYKTCSVVVCGNTTITFTGCSNVYGASSYCSGDEYFRLYLGNIEVAENNDYCGSCSQISYYTGNSSCQTYSLRQGCTGYNSCYGTTYYTFSSIAVTNPSLAPTLAPTYSLSPTAVPTIAPTSSSPTALPSTFAPSNNISKSPTAPPTTSPPTPSPTRIPSFIPTRTPSSSSPSRIPTFLPSTLIPTIAVTTYEGVDAFINFNSPAFSEEVRSCENEISPCAPLVAFSIISSLIALLIPFVKNIYEWINDRVNSMLTVTNTFHNGFERLHFTWDSDRKRVYYFCRSLEEVDEKKLFNEFLALQPRMKYPSSFNLYRSNYDIYSEEDEWQATELENIRKENKTSLYICCALQVFTKKYCIPTCMLINILSSIAFYAYPCSNTPPSMVNFPIVFMIFQLIFSCIIAGYIFFLIKNPYARYKS